MGACPVQAPARETDHEPMPGTETRELTDEQRALIEANLGLAWSLARRHCSDRILHIDDRVSAAIGGLVAAAMGYRPSTGAFGGYAARIIVRHLAWARWEARTIRLPRYRRYRRDGDPAPLVGSLDALDEEPPAAGPDGGTTEPEELDRLAALVATLPGRLRYVIEGLHGIGRPPATKAALARELGITRSSVGYLCGRAHDQLRRLAGDPP